MYKACLVSLHPHYVFSTATPGYCMGHSLFLRLRQLCESGVTAHIWISHFLNGKFPDLSECLRGTVLENYSMDALVNVDGVFSGHYLDDGKTTLLLLTTILGNHSARPKLERIFSAS